jgi:hypothetical protein
MLEVARINYIYWKIEGIGKSWFFEVFELRIITYIY